jgi:hypothetical protein
MDTGEPHATRRPSCQQKLDVSVCTEVDDDNSTIRDSKSSRLNTARWFPWRHTSHFRRQVHNLFNNPFPGTRIGRGDQIFWTPRYSNLNPVIFHWILSKKMFIPRNPKSQWPDQLYHGSQYLVSGIPFDVVAKTARAGGGFFEQFLSVKAQKRVKVPTTQQYNCVKRNVKFKLCIFIQLPQVENGGDGLHMRRAAANIRNSGHQQGMVLYSRGYEILCMGSDLAVVNTVMALLAP